MVEQGTHKPLDVGSNPTLATLYDEGSTPHYCRFFIKVTTLDNRHNLP